MKVWHVVAVTILVACLSACGKSGTSSQPSAVVQSAKLLAESARYPQARVDGKGNVIAVWRQSDGLYSNRYSAASGWGSPQQVAEVKESWSDLHLAMSKSGYAIATWLQGDPGSEHVKTVRYTPDAGWGTVEDLGGIGTPHDAAIDDAGRALVVTQYSDFPSVGMTLAAYDLANGWKVEQRPYASSLTSAGFPRLALDGSGTGLLFWVENDYDMENAYSVNKVYVSKLSASGWSDATEIASVAGIAIGNNTIAMNGKGEAIAAWVQTDSSGLSRTFACSYTPDGGWGAAERLDHSNKQSLWPSLAVDPAGSFYAGWIEVEDNGLSVLHTSKYLGATGWQSSKSASFNGTACLPRLASDPFGNIIAAWQQYDFDGNRGDANVYVNVLKNGGQWGMQQRLPRPAGGADGPELVVDPSSRTTVIWAQSTGSVNGSVTYGVYYWSP